MSDFNKVLVTGGAGFLGSHVVDELKARGYSQIIVPRSAEFDLTQQEHVRRLLDATKPDLIISLPLREAREIFERDYLLAQINRFGGNISRTASFIGMERSALHRKLKSLGVSSARLEQPFNA